MSDPAELFMYGIPLRDSPVLSGEMRDNFEALARCFYTTQAIYPAAPRKGQLRILDVNSGVAVKLQWYSGSVWQTILSGLENYAAPGKMVYPFVNETTLIIDHLYGSLPLVQIVDLSGNLIAPISGIGTSYDVVNLVQFATPVAVTTKEVWRVPQPLDGKQLQDISFGVHTAGTGGDCTFQVTLDPVDGSPDTDLLSPVATIEDGDRSSELAAVQPSIVAHTLAKGDFLVFKVLTVGAVVAPLGLQVGMRFSGGSGGGGGYSLTHVNPNRVQVIFPSPTSGNAILVG